MASDAWRCCVARTNQSLATDMCCQQSCPLWTLIRRLATIHCRGRAPIVSASRGDTLL